MGGSGGPADCDRCVWVGRVAVDAEAKGGNTIGRRESRTGGAGLGEVEDGRVLRVARGMA